MKGEQLAQRLAGAGLELRAHHLPGAKDALLHRRSSGLG